MTYQDGDFFFGRNKARDELARHLTLSRHGSKGDDPNALKHPLMVDELKPARAKDYNKRPMLIRKGVGGKKGDPISAGHPEYNDEKLRGERCLRGVIMGHEKYKDTFNLLKNPKVAHEQGPGFAHKCKAGLTMALQENRQIHYALDGIKMDAVVGKSGGRRAGDSITSRELRWLFRNREEEKSGLLLHFYFNNLEVPAPWISDPDLWAGYVQTAYRDLKGKLYLPNSEDFFDSVKRIVGKRPELIENIGDKLDAYQKGTWRNEGIEGRLKALDEIDKLCKKALTSRKVNSARRPGVRTLQDKVAKEIARIKEGR